MTNLDDQLLFGWDPTPGIVSVWADRSGMALVWRRVSQRVVCERVRFRPWLFAAQLDDLLAAQVPFGYDADPPGQPAPLMVRELAGPSKALRYLISARDGRVLERTLLQGASQRRGVPITSLYDLPDYYRVGVVEQYLISSGRVYFRGLHLSDLVRLQFDLETTALTPDQGRIFMIAMRDSRGWSMVLEAPTPEDEPGMLVQFCDLVRQRDPDVLENHNLFGFDLPFLVGRAEALGVQLRLSRREAPARLERYDDPTRGGERGRRARFSIPGRECVDTLDAVRRHDFVARDLPSHRLKDVARAFGIASPERTYLRGAEVYQTFCSQPELVRQYALDDVAEVDGLSLRLHSAPFALAGMAPRRYERVASAGPAMGILEPMLVRAYVRAGAALPLPDPAQAQLPPHTGGALHLFATGVAQRVVKADVASLYPSLMRAYAIGPASDQQQALLRLVARLTDQRLQHKQAARQALAGSLEAGYHTAMQAAMKLIINSAYGYLGAGSMALFADRYAADEITRRGRELLGEVVAQLRQRGVTLIEADTDGVFFAVPPGWDEIRERQVVAEVAATLPNGISLEYDGRYAAMLSHEVKNYALLRYRGDLLMRGVAFRSIRSERYGEQFLQQALTALLQGDVVGVWQAFQRTVAALQQRHFVAADVATRARLSKTAEAYIKLRAKHREAPYEALLAAGVEDWRVGRRIRWYRAVGGYRWLPDEEDQREDLLEEPYDVDYYLNQLLNSYADRLRKAFHPEDFAQLFRLEAQLGLFDRHIHEIVPVLINDEPTSSNPC